MFSNVISLAERKDINKAANLVFAISKLDSSIASFNTRPSDLFNIAQEFLSLKHVSIQSLADYTGHNTFEIKVWLSGDLVPEEPKRTAIILGMDTHVKEVYHIKRH